MKNTLYVTTALLAFAGAASAGNPNPVVIDVPVVAPPAATAIVAPVDWSGMYAGLTYGFGVDGNTTYTGQVPVSYPALTSGSSYGAFVGYNFQNNKMVYGVELAYSEVSNPSFGPLALPADTFDYFLDAKARVGVTFGSVLAYGFVGYSGSHYTQTAGANWDMDGVNYGVGADFMVGANLFIGAEYIVRELSGSAAAIAPGTTQDSNIQEIQLRAGWKF